VRPLRPFRSLTIALSLGMWLASCGGDTSRTAMVPSSFASLTEAIDEARGVEVEWVLASSARLVEQLADGAAADVLITADQETMQVAVETGLVDPPLGLVARNRLVLAVAPGNPAGVASVRDLTNPDLLLGVCAREVPCGRLAEEAATSLGITIASDTEEPNVRSLALKIMRGELDAGLVYATDALANSLPTVDDDALAVFVTEYPAATVDGGSTDVVDYLRSDEGRALLLRNGFTLP
jgi:molybdate transport system substrate-binding protein